MAPLGTGAASSGGTRWGFIGSITFPTVEEAETLLDEMFPPDEDEGDDLI